ncbi:MAG TPA: sulfotransferase family 2 domain-containing protein [Alphaproteobacteria bacterium]|nr:sulfotransferase family 2 domain-containing protein [Alphaproteobacteria bacterium]
MVSIDELSACFNGFADLNYSVHIDPDLRFVYFNNPKSACTTTKASLNLSYSQYKGVALNWADSNAIHLRAVNLMLAPTDVGTEKFLEMIEDPGVFKFCFLREPVSRVASAYASKFSWASRQQQLFAELAGQPTDWRPSFAEFVMEMTRDPALRDCDEHWRLQTRQLCLGKVPYDFIGDFAAIGDTLPGLLERFFGSSKTVFDARRHFRGNSSNSSAVVKAASSEVLAAIAELYAEDFDWYQKAAPGRGDTAGA